MDTFSFCPLVGQFALFLCSIVLMHIAQQLSPE